MDEQILAQAVITWLEGYDVYQEVETKGKRADIVVACGDYGWVIECKCSLGFAVLEQAYSWRRMGIRRVSVAVYQSKGQGRRFAEEVCGKYGIGLIDVGKKTGYVREKVEPSFNRLRWLKGDILNECRPQHKTMAKAGSRNGGHWTPFAETSTRLRVIVRGQPGICLKDAVYLLKHHYASNSSARSSLGHWLHAGKIEGVRVEQQGRRLALFPIS